MPYPVICFRPICRACRGPLAGCVTVTAVLHVLTGNGCATRV